MNEIDREAERQLRVIERAAAEIVPREELAAKLRASVSGGRPLRVKYGIDPTDPHIHIGHLVPCRVMRTFQELGHTAVLIIGDYTARIGDPTGRNAERVGLSEAEVRANMQLYTEQLFRVVDRERAEVHRQSTWYDRLSIDELVRLLARFSVAGLLAHETFRERLDAGARLSVHELVYPVLQAYDSLMIRADVEIGGSDQRFNCLCGRDLQRATGLEPQVVVTVPLLSGLDGRKMSKSLGNHVALDLDAGEVVGRIMSIADELLDEYVTLATDWTDAQKSAAREQRDQGTLHPRTLKLRIAENVAEQLHGTERARAAIEEFERVFGKKERPAEVERTTVDRAAIGIIDLLLAVGTVASRSEARRLIEQGGVRIDGKVVASTEQEVAVEVGSPRLLQVGKRRFREIVRAGATSP